MIHRPPTQENINRNLVGRVRNLERATPGDDRPKREETALFTQSGALTVTAAADAPNYEVEHGGQLVSVIANLAVAGSTDSVFTIYRDGVSLGTVTVASSATRGPAYLGAIRIANGELLSVRCTTAGTGASSATVRLRMKG